MGVFLKEDFRHDDFYKDMKLVYTIHNLKYQGIYPPSIMRDIIGLPQELFDKGNLECDGCVNYMKSGLVYADRVTTSARRTLRKSPILLRGSLDGYIRANRGKVSGILNGLDVDAYNPETDPYIKKQYSVDTARADKRENKDALRAELGLRIKRGVPLIAMVTRLVEDKGLDLVMRIMDELVDDEVQLVLVGTGDAGYEDAFRELAYRHPNKVSANIMFNEALAHKYMRRRICSSCRRAMNRAASVSSSPFATAPFPSFGKREDLRILSIPSISTANRAMA